VRALITPVVLVAVAVACSSAPTAPAQSEPTIQELRSAPQVVVISGLTIEPNVTLRRNFQPLASDVGVLVTIRLPASAASVAVERVWLLLGDEMWSGDTIRNSGSGPTEWVTRDGPKWSPGVTVDVVCRVRGSDGIGRLVRTAAVSIIAVA